ncbi:thioesterase domain-containing protein [Kitasatospora sp. NPDC094015]|uniref:thioesterase II family protein n=1 Tax=Kitasatospora sp. NPDC094015 TaxID=3155205 RepID=UPI00331CD33D
MYTTFRQPLLGDRRLICLPHAGGSANDYRHWAGAVPGVDVIAARLPGRDSRFAEPAATEFEPLVDHLLAELTPYLGTPYALFGHSMGGLLGYELGRRLEAAGHGPELVIAAGTAAPAELSGPHPSGAPADDLPSDEVLLDELRRDRAAPPEVLADAELMALLLPVLRADLAVVASYRDDPARPPLRAPLRLYHGRDEVPDPDRLVAGWAPSVTGTPRAHGFPGGHFFVRTASDEVLARLTEDLYERTAVR